MNRRSLLKYSVLLGVAKSGLVSVAADAQPTKESIEKMIVLYCDLAINPAREQEMLHHFHFDF